MLLPTVRFSEQIDFSNAQQPGTANISKGITANTPATPGNETINYSGPLTPGTVTVEGSPNGAPLPAFFGQKFLTNDLTRDLGRLVSGHTLAYLPLPHARDCPGLSS